MLIQESKAYTPAELLVLPRGASLYVVATLIEAQAAASVAELARLTRRAVREVRRLLAALVEAGHVVEHARRLLAGGAGEKSPGCAAGVSSTSSTSSRLGEESPTTGEKSPPLVRARFRSESSSNSASEPAGELVDWSTVEPSAPPCWRVGAFVLSLRSVGRVWTPTDEERGRLSTMAAKYTPEAWGELVRAFVADEWCAHSAASPAAAMLSQAARLRREGPARFARPALTIVGAPVAAPGWASGSASGSASRSASGSPAARVPGAHTPAPALSASEAAAEREQREQKAAQWVALRLAQAERIEAERIEAERIEAERRAERIEAQRIEAERRAAEYASQAERERQARTAAALGVLEEWRAAGLRPRLARDIAAYLEGVQTTRQWRRVDEQLNPYRPEGCRAIGAAAILAA
jgi:hypothetical protein